MKGLIFETPISMTNTASNRTDLVCFIGLAKVRDGAIPDDLRKRLQDEGWWARSGSAGSQSGGDSLYDVPVFITSWEHFDQLFAWEQRSFAHQVIGATYLGAAVRSFFAQGGRQCYVISCGEPVTIDTGRVIRDALLLKLVPKYTGQRSKREQWQGLHHIFGLPDISFVALPDLAELVGTYQKVSVTQVALPPTLPEFVECSEPAAEVERESRVVFLAAPACGDEEYDRWCDVVHRATRCIAEHRPDMQLLAAIPMPCRESEAAADLLGFMHTRGWLTGSLSAKSYYGVVADPTGTEDRRCSIASAFLQLIYPWVQTGYGGDLPANIEPPEGVIAGVLAGNGLTRGTFRNATKLLLHEVEQLAPRQHPSEQTGINPKAPVLASPNAPLIDRVSILGQTPEGYRMLSDVTTSNSISYRQASIGRTIGQIMRLARTIGDEYVFEASGERLWGQIRSRMEDVLGAMQRVGALAASKPETPFQVRCDRSTMTQQDIDNGRVVVQVLVRPVACIETMRIHLSFGDSGQVALSSLGMEVA